MYIPTDVILPKRPSRSPGRDRARVEELSLVEGPAVGRTERESLDHSPRAAGRGQARLRIAEATRGHTSPQPPEETIAYVYDHRFDEPDAGRRFLAPVPLGTRGASACPRSLDRLPPYLASLYAHATLLRPEEEEALFLRMNYLKYRASQLRKALAPSGVRPSELDEIDRLLREALAVRNHIVRSCLRLVVFVVKRYARPGQDYGELVSEGNLSLMRAVEKFDVARGFKFSTYATCAITRNLVRMTATEMTWRRRFADGPPELLDVVCDDRPDALECERGRDRERATVRQLLEQLSEREREVIVNRFGLEGAPRKTLRRLGEDLGICRERVRQIEQQARDKLRRFALEAGPDPTAA